MAKFSETSDAKKGGLFVGDSHAEGGIPAIVTDTGQPIEVEGGEAIINKKATALHWEELSKINQSAGGGVPIPPPDDADKVLDKYNQGGTINNKEKKLIFDKWKKLVNMTYTELSRYYHSKEGKESGLSEAEAKAQGISSGRESAEWILKMKKTNWKKWSDDMWKWANKQISFISRMSGLQGDLTNDKGKKTRKYQALLIWGNNPKKKNAYQFNFGGTTDKSNDKKDNIKNNYLYFYDNSIRSWVAYPVDDKGDRIEFDSNENFIEANYFANKSQLDTWLNSKAKFKTGGGIPETSNNYAFVTSKTTTGKRLFKVFDHIPTNKEVFDYYQQVNKKIGTPVTIVDSSIEIEVLSGFDRDEFLKLLNEVALIQFSSKIKDIKELMFSFDSKTFNVYEFEAELNYGRVVKVKMVDGVILLEDKYEKGGVPEYHLGGDMSKHLAPNGNPSNLTHEQWHLVRTPEFKKWFGDWENSPESASKVVDTNGEPMVVWHTTNNEFNKFDKRKSREGFFFSPQKNRLVVYNKSKINSYFLNLRNPSHEKFKLDLKYLKPKGYDGIMDYGHAKHLGNESLYEIIAFESNQIKLADGTNTTFDGNNPDIRFKDGGAVKELSKKEKQIVIENQNKVFSDGLPMYKLSADGKWVMKLNSRTNKYNTHNKFDLFYESILDREREAYAKENAKKVSEYLDNNGAELLNKSIYGSRYYIYKNNHIRVSNHHNQSEQTNKETGLSKYKSNEHNFYSYEKDGWKEMINKIESINPDIRFETGGAVQSSQLKTIKESYDFGSEYFDGVIYGQTYKIRMNKNHPRNSSRNDDQSIHNLSLVNVDYPSSRIFRESNNKLQWQVDKINYWEDAEEQIIEFFSEIKDRQEEFETGGAVQKPSPDIYENKLLQIRVIAGENSYYKRINQEWKFLSSKELELLKDGTKHELEHIETIEAFKRKDIPNEIVATFIAYDHINEDLYYYKKLDKAIPEKMEKGKKIDSEKYTYALTIRPFDSGGYPKQNFIRVVQEAPEYKYGLLEYSMPLDDTAIQHYSLAPVSEILQFDGTTLDYYEGNFAKVKIERDSYNTPTLIVDFYDKETNEKTHSSELTGKQFREKINSGDWKIINPPISNPESTNEANIIEKTNETPMEQEQANPTGLITNNWNEVPVRWKNVKAVRPVTFSINPFDKGLQSIVKVFTGDDQLRPIMSGIRFEEKGLVVTDAHKLLHLAYKHSDFIGNYPSFNSQKAYGKYTTKEDIQKQLNEGKFPNWEAVIPRNSEYVYEIDTMKLYQYCKVAINYANKTTHQVKFKFENKAIGFNVKFMIDSLEAMMKIQKAPILFIHLTEPSRAAILSFEKSFSVVSSTYTLLMPVHIFEASENPSPKYKSFTQIYGAADIDFNKSLGCYFDFTDNNIHNANGTIAEYQESYGDSGGLPLDIITLMDRFIKISKPSLPILENVLVDGNGIRVDNLDSRIEIANDWNVPQGLYSISNNALVKSGINANLEDYPRITKRVPTSNEIFSINADVFKFYIEKASNHILNDDLRPVMNGICFEAVNSKLSIVSTDAHTLFHADLSKYAPNYSHNFSFIVPDIKQILNFCKNINSEKVNFYVDNLNPVNFRIGAGRIHFEGRLEDGKYPNWRAIVPETFSKQLIFDLKDMYNCLNNELAKSFSKDVDEKPKDLTIFNQSNKIFISEKQDRNNPDEAKTKEICEVKITKEEFNSAKSFNIDSNFVLLMPVMNTNGTNFNFNVGKFNDVISTIGKEKVIIDYNTLSNVYIFTSDNLDFNTSDVYKPKKSDKPISTKTKYVGSPSNREKTLAAIEKNPPAAYRETKPTFSSEAIKLIPHHQMQVLKSTKFSEMEDVISKLNSVAKVTPKLYGQDGVKDKMIYLHYFYANQDWYVTELDKSTGECFGYANLGYGAELGYMSISEFVSNGKVELDFYFEPKKWSEISPEKATAFEKQNKAVKPLAKPTEKVLGTEYKVGTKGHAKAVAQKKQFDDLSKSESGISEDAELKNAIRGLEAFMKTTSNATEKSQLKQAINGLKALSK